MTTELDGQPSQSLLNLLRVILYQVRVLLGARQFPRLTSKCPTQRSSSIEKTDSKGHFTTSVHARQVQNLRDPSEIRIILDSGQLTIPGSKPPSVIPNRALTPMKPALFLTKPKHMVTSPHAIVRAGSQTLGDSFFRTRLLGISLFPKLCQPCHEQQAFVNYKVWPA